MTKLTFSYIDFGILRLELAGRCSRRTRWGTSRPRTATRTHRMGIGVVGLHTAAISKKIAHQKQGDDAEDHEATTPGCVHNGHNPKIDQFTRVSQFFPDILFVVVNIATLFRVVSTWLLTLFSMASRRAGKKGKLEGENESSFFYSLFENVLKLLLTNMQKSDN